MLIPAPGIWLDRARVRHPSRINPERFVIISYPVWKRFAEVLKMTFRKLFLGVLISVAAAVATPIVNGVNAISFSKSELEPVIRFQSTGITSGIISAR